MSTKFLDLDSLQDDLQITIKLKGETHALKEMSVADFIWVQQRSKDLEANQDELSNIKSLVEIIHRQFPTTKIEDLQELPLSKLMSIGNFVREATLNGAESAIQAAKEGNATPST